jgi:hypothetical protein
MDIREGAYCISMVSSFDAGRYQSLAAHPEFQGAAETILDFPLEDEDTVEPPWPADAEAASTPALSLRFRKL